MLAVSALVMFTPLPPVTLEETLGLPSQEAGERVLQGVEHGPVVAVVRPPRRGLELPYTVDLELVEQATEQPRGCSRQRWRLTFQHAPDADEGSATLTARRAGLEIASSCEAKQFAHLNPGLSRDQGLAVLDRLRLIQRSTSRVRFTCTDKTASGLCVDDRAIRTQLATLDPWAVARRDGAVILWLGKPGSVVTEVRLDPREPDHVFVERRIPAPA